MSQPTDIEIARNASVKHIQDIAAKIDIDAKYLINFGNDKAKIKDDINETIKEKKNGKLILVTAVSPTAAGEGKTTTTVGIGDALWSIGKKTAICLREPSLGPCFGMKGGAAGGGYAQVVPMEDINLHFTGDFHAISSAHNLLAAMLDNHIYWGNKLDIDTRRINWKRVIDLNDRSLRQIISALGGVANGFVMQSGFDITVASEIMAILCLAKDKKDLERRINNIIVAYDRKKQPVLAKQLQATGALCVLLKDAMLPNLVQTIENNPAFIHGGPFANIAHGCNSAIATKTALKLADFVVTEAGFGADLGAEKFLNIKCPILDIKPDVVVIVATIRALKINGGANKNQMFDENIEILKKGISNLDRHIKNIKLFGLPVIVAINHFDKDTKDEIKIIQEFCKQKHNVEAILCTHWKHGSKGTQEIAEKIVQITKNENNKKFYPLYQKNMKIIDKIRTIAQKIYHAKDISYSEKIAAQIQNLQEQGFGNFPVCIAKTQYSFSIDPTNIGAPVDHIIAIREIRIAAGAEFIIVVCGNIMTMPGLPSKPAAHNIKLDHNGLIQGLF